MATPISSNMSPESLDMQKFYLPSSVPPPSSSSSSPSNQSQLLNQSISQTPGIPLNSVGSPTAPLSNVAVSSSQSQMMGAPHPQLLPSSSYPPPTVPNTHHPQPPFPSSSYLNNQHLSLFHPLSPYSSPIHHVDHPSAQLNPNSYHPSANFLPYSHSQRSISFPTPSVQPHSQMQPIMYPHRFSPDRSGAELMALLRPSAAPTAPTVPELPSYSQSPPIIRVPSSVSAKQPRGRKIAFGNQNQPSVEYDIDIRMPGEAQPQLEVTPITKYVSDPQLCLGRQIAVNKSYICYGLKQGSIRILNINTAVRSLFRTHSQRINDMAFFAEDVHLLASAGADGRIVVWKIFEGLDEEDKPKISGTTVVAVQVVGVGEIRNPRICWHCYKQEILVVGVGKVVLKLDTNKVKNAGMCDAEHPLQCPVDNLIDGIHVIGSHDGEVTDLSMCQWMTTRLVSASIDGTVKIWDDQKTTPLLVLKPYDGQPVYTASFLTAPNKPDHIVLVTAGPLNREVKIWISAIGEGWMLPSDSDVLKCIQTVELKSSQEPRIEEAFFNQTVALPQVGLLLLANAKKNAIYAMHIDYGPNPAATHIDYISEFTVKMPILSLTGTSDVVDGQAVAQVYCVQTQAIQQYTLDICQCLPLDAENCLGEKADHIGTLVTLAADELSFQDQITKQVTEFSVDGSPPDVAAQEQELSNCLNISVALSSSQCDIHAAYESPSHGVKRLEQDDSSKNQLESCSAVIEKQSDQQIIQFGAESLADEVYVSVSEAPSFDVEGIDSEKTVAQKDNLSNLCHSIAFNHPTHLITPSEILMGASPSEITDSGENDESQEDDKANIRDTEKNDDGNDELEVTAVDEMKSVQHEVLEILQDTSDHLIENKQRYFCSQASGLGLDVAKEFSTLSAETYVADEPKKIEGISGTDSVTQPSKILEDDSLNCIKEISRKAPDSSMPLLNTPSSTPISKGRKQKGRNFQVSGIAPQAQNVFNSADSLSELVGTSASEETANSQINNMHELLNQLLNSHKEMQKQISNMVAVPVAKECKRLESVLGRSIEKATKASTDALWARIQEENAKNEKLMRERTQQLSTSLTSLINKEMTNVVEKAVKKEVASLGTALSRTLSPIIEKSVSSALAESFQKGVGDKAVAQLEKSMNSKLEVTVARQIQAQFQTSGKQALQEAFKSGLESSLIPAFDKSCKAMFEQVDATFQKGLSEHTSGVHQHFDSSHSQLAHTLRDVLNSASALTQKLNAELIDNQRKLIALATAAGANSGAAGNPLAMQLSNGPVGGFQDKVETPVDPTKELGRMIGERKYDEAFNFALQRSDVSMVSWLCSQVDVHAVLAMDPVPLSQGVLLSLLQQLGCDIARDTSRKLAWMTEVAGAINPADPMIALHIRPISEQLLLVLRHLRSAAALSGPDNSSVRVLSAVITSFLAHCK